MKGSFDVIHYYFKIREEHILALSTIHAAELKKYFFESKVRSTTVLFPVIRPFRINFKQGKESSELVNRGLA